MTVPPPPWEDEFEARNVRRFRRLQERRTFWAFVRMLFRM